MDPKLIEAWLRLTAEAFKGAEEARKALGALAQTSPKPEDLSRWLAPWLPAPPQREAPKPSDLQEVMEQWWKTMGVVPRYRYVELLRKYEELKGRLEAAEETVKNLREVLSQQGREGEARGILDRWEASTRQALESQAELARSWMEEFLGVTDKKDAPE
ncbi:MAG: hypothetical protein Kow0092_09160 [Deferrisomatales bacterium]